MPLVLGHRLESERFVGKLLVVGKRVGSVVVQYAQRAEVGRVDAELLAEMLPQTFGNLFVSIERAPSHPLW
ncbi:hypothetical protein WS48_23890 [Burkholderia sp. RF7-non_BP1]|nr:hypothetical protein WS45_10890 [Burkholderia sp. RF2-non_BP3]KUY72923.1 hypothetical protein WS46_03255 [Burkholderia sp. RF4-BP95]KUY92851.1 hypothetical protein WS48_23890 [Burkholderia sp. RF7-non_BP1]KUZ05578.1 hypothetical protein WS49_05950 [Burkholderia sp. RF7-non_BP4]